MNLKPKVAGILTGLGLAGEFFFFMASGYSPEIFNDPIAARAFLSNRGTLLRLAILFGALSVVARTLFAVGIILSGFEGLGNFMLGLMLLAASSAIITHKALPVGTGWAALLVGLMTIIRVFSTGTPRAGPAFAVFLPSLILAKMLISADFHITKCSVKEKMMKKTGYVNVGSGKLWYEIGGDGDTLVLVHAGFVDSRMWDDQWDPFTKRYRVIRFDQRGFGKSDPVQGPVSRRADLLRLLDVLEVERAALLGSSMGGEVVMDVALEHPERVSALIVASATPSGFELQGTPPRYVMEMMDAAKRGDLERTSDLQIRIWVDGPSREPEQVDSSVRQRVTAMNRIPVEHGTFFVADGQPVNPLDPPAATRLKEIRMPTLVIAGELDDPEILRAADMMASEIQGAQKVIIPNSAHLQNMENPQMFNETVLDFLDGLKKR